MEAIESLTEQVMQLPVGQRLTIAQRILASMDENEEPGLKGEWEQEIRTRIERYDRDPGIAMEGSVVLAELDAKLRQ